MAGNVRGAGRGSKKHSVVIVVLQLLPGHAGRKRATRLLKWIFLETSLSNVVRVTI